MTIDVKEADGSITQESRTLYRSHFGPMLVIKAAGIQPDAVHRARLGRLALGTLAVGQWRLMMGYERF